jgi:hypothetical protein
MLRLDVRVVDGDVDDLDADGIGVFAERARQEGWRVGDTLPVTFGGTGRRSLTAWAGRRRILAAIADR